MSELRIGASLVMDGVNTPTRKGEIVSSLEEIYNIPTPYVGMKVWCGGKAYIVTELEGSEIAGVFVPELKVKSFEALVSESELANEISRAQAAEKSLQSNIAAEVERATAQEQQLQKNINAEIARAQTAEGKLRESTTARFARIVESASISTGEPDSFKEVVYIKSANKFAAADDGNAYWDTWNGMDEYMNGNEVRKDKVYLCGNDIYVWNNSGLSVSHSDLYHIQITKRTDIVIVETPARKGGVIKASDGFGGYHFDLSKLYAEGYRSIRFRGANYTIENDIVRGVVVAKDGAVESFIETVAAKTNGWNELPIKPNSSYLWASYTKASPVLYGELFTPEYIEIMKPSGIVPTLNQKVDSVVGNLQRVGSINMLNPYDLLKGYSLSLGMIIPKNDGIFSNKLILDVGKVYSFVNIALFSGTSANDTIGTIFVAKYNSSDEFIGRDFSLVHKVEDGYATATYTPTDPNVSYYRILLQSGSNVNYPFDSSKAMIYCGEFHLDFIPYKDDLLRSYFDMQQDARLNALESAIERPCMRESKNNILLTGASFADGNYNQWFKIVCEKLGVTGYNKAVSGESIIDTAIKLNSNTLYSFEEFEDFETLLIMHVHNRDVCDNIGLQDDYRNYIVSNTMSYSQAYDYVLKKYAADCYAAKDNSASKWYGSKYGKPCRVVCMTHWHDARTIFNDSIRLLKDKWGFGLIELDKYIGFTKHQLHPISGQQQSVIYAVDTEVIDGVTYGWHPDRTEIAGDYPVIQKRIAKIVADCLTRPTSSNENVELKQRVIQLSDAIIAEKSRAQSAEDKLHDKIETDVAAEATRATAAEQELRESLRGVTINTRVRNGSQGNGGNLKVITIYGYATQGIPVTEGEKYIVSTTRPNREGCKYYINIQTYTRADVPNLYTDVVRSAVNYSDTNVATLLPTIDKPITIGEGEKGLSIQLLEFQEGGNLNNTPLRISDFNDYSLVVTKASGVIQRIDDIDRKVAELTPTNIVFERNKEKTIALTQACRLRKSAENSKDYQMLICTDSHDNSVVVDNAVMATNGFETIDAMIHCGDIVGGHYIPDNAVAFNERADKCEKPLYVVVGNHDVGNTWYVAACATHVDAYNSFIKPMVDKGVLKSGEYQEGKPYWYHDDTTNKVRLIGLYEYDDPMDFDTAYWKPIPYDATLPIITKTTYNVGDKVNARAWGYDYSPPYTGYSFECVQACTISGATFHNAITYLPKYKIQRGMRVIRQEQAQWFLDTLASTPANYTVIVAMHNPFSDAATTIQSKFTQNPGLKGADYSQNLMQTDFIRNAIVAFIKGSNYTESVVMKGEAAYLNVPSGDGGEYAYTVSKDFRTKNSGVSFGCILGGHTHRDLVWKDASENIYQVTPICATTEVANSRNNDIARTLNDGIAKDCLTVFSQRANEIALVKIGCDTTISAVKRDFEVLKTNG